MAYIMKLSEYRDWLRDLKQQIKNVLYSRQGKAVFLQRHCGLDPQSPQKRRNVA